MLENKNINFSSSDMVSKSGEHSEAFLRSAYLRSSYILQFKIACISFSTTLQKGHNRKFSAKPSYRPVSILNGATPHLNLLKAANRIDVYETLCPQQMLVPKGGKIKNWGDECRDVTPTKSLSQNIRVDENREVKFL